jgi:hypothetical protein
LDAGVINKDLIKIMNDILNFFLTKGDKIPEGKFSEYMSILADILEILVESKSHDIADEYFIINKLENDVKLLIKYIKDFSAFLGSPTKAKTTKLMAIRRQLIKARGVYYEPNRTYESPDFYGEESLGESSRLY